MLKYISRKVIALSIGCILTSQVTLVLASGTEDLVHTVSCDHCGADKTAQYPFPKEQLHSYDGNGVGPKQFVERHEAAHKNDPGAHSFTLHHNSGAHSSVSHR